MYINMDKPLPPDIDGVNLPEEFINQFQNKIEMIKECIDKVLPLFTKIINLSLSLGEMPKDLKLGTIKTFGLNLVTENYRPVSNFPMKTDRENCSPANY